MSWQVILLLIVGYSAVFFIMALRETKNLKDAIDEWIRTMLDWRDHAVPGLIFLLILALLGFIIGESNVHPN